jgi:hypothetical protein
MITDESATKAHPEEQSDQARLHFSHGAHLIANMAVAPEDVGSTLGISGFTVSRYNHQNNSEASLDARGSARDWRTPKATSASPAFIYFQNSNTTPGGSCKSAASTAK